MISGNGSSAAPAAVARVVLHLDEIERHEEQARRQRRVQQQRQQVGERERPRSEERQRQHRAPRATLHDDEHATSETAPDRERAEHERMRRAERRPFEEPEDDAAEAEDGERRAGPVDPATFATGRGSRP